MTDAVKIVPVEADATMLSAGRKWAGVCASSAQKTYDAMLSAAPASDYVAVRRSDLAAYMKGEPHPSTEASYLRRCWKFINARDRLRAALEQ